MGHLCSFYFTDVPRHLQLDEVASGDTMAQDFYQTLSGWAIPMAAPPPRSISTVIAHPESDKLFLVLEGELTIDFREHESVILYPNDLFTIPAGIIHRTRSSQRTVNLCFEQTKATTEFIE